MGIKLLNHHCLLLSHAICGEKNEKGKDSTRDGWHAARKVLHLALPREILVLLHYSCSCLCDRMNNVIVDGALI